MAPLPAQPHRHTQGFTLVEVLVALSVMAVLSLVSLRAFDAMSISQRHTREHGDQLLRLQNALSQWTLDLDAVTTSGAVPALSFDGRVLRLTRRDPLQTETASPGVTVVGWALHEGQWQRWQASGLRQAHDIRQAWERAGALDGADWLPLAPANGWSLFYFRGNSWSNPQSAPGDGQTALPDGVRLQLSLRPGQALAGDLQIDWANPVLARGAAP